MLSQPDALLARRPTTSPAVSKMSKSPDRSGPDQMYEHTQGVVQKGGAEGDATMYLPDGSLTTLSNREVVGYRHFLLRLSAG